MSILKTEDKNKWINAFVAVTSILAAECFHHIFQAVRRMV